MLQIRKSTERGHADHGWLKSHHTFSFAEYYDPAWRSFGALRVINEDWIEGGQGFGTHPHADMEIISYVMEGALEHKDSMGNSTIIRPGEVQRMSAGTGVEHSEFSHYPDRRTHLFQIWIRPAELHLEPSYEQKSFEAEFAQKPLVLVASRDGRDGSLTIHQDADVYISRLAAGQSFDFTLRPGRKLWIQTLRGGFEIGGHTVKAGDALYTSDAEALRAQALEPGELMIFDLGT